MWPSKNRPRASLTSRQFTSTVKPPDKGNALSSASPRCLQVVILDSFGLGNESSQQKRRHKSTYETGGKSADPRPETRLQVKHHNIRGE